MNQPDSADTHFRNLLAKVELLHLIDQPKVLEAELRKRIDALNQVIPQGEALRQYRLREQEQTGT